MNTDDIVYLALLFFSLGFGVYYRKVQSASAKKNIGALVGLAIVCIVSGFHAIHILITVFVNALIILYTPKSQCHVISFAFSFIYLYLSRMSGYFGIPYPPNHTNLIQMILTLKLSGLAFEVNNSYVEKKSLELSLSDICYYSLHYCGILTGPYFKYATFVDHLEKPFNKYDDYLFITAKKFFPSIPLFAIIYLLLESTWPLYYTQTPEFQERSFWYRYWYIWPTFTIFRMRIYIGILLSECVCIMAGLGIYPVFTKPKPGKGPTENFEKMKEICDHDMSLKCTQYDYETIHNIYPYGSDFCPTYREGMKHWNMTVQYWLGVNVYKRFPSKKYRTFATLFVSANWHGAHLGYYFCNCTVPLGLLVEDVWVPLLTQEGSITPPAIGNWILWFLKMQLFSYQVMAFTLLDISKFMLYYNSVYHSVAILYVLLYFIGKYLLKSGVKRDKEAKLS